MLTFPEFTLSATPPQKTPGLVCNLSFGVSCWLCHYLKYSSSCFLILLLGKLKAGQNLGVDREKVQVEMISTEQILWTEILTHPE